MKTTFNKRGQDAPLQNIYLGFLVVFVAVIAVTNWVTGLTSNYDTPTMDSTLLSDVNAVQNETTNSIQGIRETIANPESSGVTQLIDIIVGGGFQTLINFLTAPFVIANSLITTVFASLGLEAFAPLAFYAVVVLAVFAILALIMKVRA